MGRSKADWFALCYDGEHGPTAIFLRGYDPLLAKGFVRVRAEKFTPTALTETLKELTVGHL